MKNKSPFSPFSPFSPCGASLKLAGRREQAHFPGVPVPFFNACILGRVLVD